MSTNGARPATIEDLEKLKTELVGEMAAQRAELVEAIHDSETRLLKAFYSYAEAAQKHFVDLDQASFAFRDRLGAVETRLMEVEKRLNMNPGS